MIFVPLSSPASRPPFRAGTNCPSHQRQRCSTSASGYRRWPPGLSRPPLSPVLGVGIASSHAVLSARQRSVRSPQRGRGLWPHLFTVQHYVKVPASSHVPICHLSSVFRNAGVDLVGPGEDSTLQVLDLAEPGLHQQFHGLRASHSGAAMDYDFIRRVEFVHALRNFS